VYRLAPDPTCKPLPSSAAPGATLTVDPDCANDLQRLQVRIVARPDCDGTRYSIVVGPDKLELAQLIVRSDLLALEMDLAKSRRASEYANQTLGKAGSPPPYPQKLEGALRLGLQKLGPKKATFVVAVTAPLQIESEGDEPMQLRVDKGEPFSLSADGIGKTITVTTNVGQTDVTAPWDPRNRGLKNLDLHVSIGGVYGQATLTEAARELSIKSLGVGSSFVAVRGMHIFDLNLNADAGRKLDLRTVLGANDTPRYEVAPKLDLSLAFNFRAVAAEFEDPPSSALLNETYRVLLAPAGAPPAAVEVLRARTGSNGALRLLAGSLTISSSADARATVTVPMGKCLTTRDPRPPGSHELLGSLAAGDCPL
jgi:hypothetical protein